MTDATRDAARRHWHLSIVGVSTLRNASGYDSDLPSRPKRFALLLRLAIRPDTWTRRDELAVLFWPELDNARARNALRVALYDLRQTLGDEAIRSRGEGDLSVNPAIVRTDMHELERALHAHGPRAIGDVTDIQLAPGLNIGDAPGFDAWLDRERRAFRERVTRTLQGIADKAEQAGDLATAQLAARRAFDLAPDDEAAIRRLVVLLDRGGDRASALTVFEQFRRWLAAEYEAEPSPETMAIVSQVRARSATETPLSLGQAAVMAPRAKAPAGVAAPPSPRRRPSIPLVAGVTTVVVALLAWYGTRTPTTSPAGSALPLAVLPFEDSLGDTTLTYFAPALATDAAHLLGDGVGGSVLPFESTRRLASLPDSAQLLSLATAGARTVVHAVVSGRRDSIAIAVSLRDVQTVRERYRLHVHGPEEAFASLVAAITDSLREHTGIAPAAHQQVHVPDREAYRLVGEGNYLLGVRTRSALLHAREVFHQATTIDPQWPDAFIGLSDANGTLATTGRGPKVDDVRRLMTAAEHAADLAVNLDGRSAAALIRRALPRFALGDIDGFRADGRMAMALDSTDPQTQALIAGWWRWNGGPLDSAWKYTRRAQRLQSFDVQVIVDGAHLLRCANDSVAELAELERALSTEPRRSVPLRDYADVLARFGRWEKAEAAWIGSVDTLLAQRVVKRVQSLHGVMRWRGLVREEGVAKLEMLHRRAAGSQGDAYLAWIEAFEATGQRDSAVQVLDTWIATREPKTSFTGFCRPGLHNFVRDPRVQQLVRASHWPLAEFDTLRVWHLDLARP